MPINNNFILKELAGEYMIIPLSSSNVNISKILNINETGAFIFKCLENNDDVTTIISKMKNEYDIEEELLKNDVLEFIEKLKKLGIYHD